MPSLRAKLVHVFFRYLWSSKEPLTKETLLIGRKKASQFGKFVRTRQPVKKTTSTIDEIAIDIVEPKNSRSSKVIIYLHGGGYIYGMTPGHFEIVNRLAVQAKAKVFVVHYSLAPEH